MVPALCKKSLYKKLRGWDCLPHTVLYMFAGIYLQIEIKKLRHPGIQRLRNSDLYSVFKSPQALTAQKGRKGKEETIDVSYYTANYRMAVDLYTSRLLG